MQPISICTSTSLQHILLPIFYIHLLTRFLYSRYFSPKVSSIFFSSKGIKTTRIINRKINGIIIEAILPKHNEIPRINKNIPRYIGFLLSLKIPSSIILFDTSKVRVVSCTLNNLFAHPSIPNPKTDISIPAKLYGTGIILNLGVMK